jgi:predicted transcriptional regulator
MTPLEYRARFNLPASYPMVAPDYTTRRREIAHALGLGRNRKGRGKAAAAPPPAAADEPAKPRRGRRKAS